VAVLLVVLFHAGIPHVTGGYVGVDVFFVISGFVITGVLLRERASTGGTSVLAFYGRRCRRIIPAAALVIIVTSVLAYFVVDAATGGRAADDGRWASLFLANFHFASIGTNYFAAQQPPSPLQNYWSLSVEEQFYVIYPTLFLVVASLRTSVSLRARLAVMLGVVIVASFVFSVLDTSAHPTSAYFSPLTRAWELALGALVAVATPWLLSVPKRVAAVVSWVGMAAIVVTGVTFTAATAYPGSLVAIPVVGAALLIAAGMSAPRYGAEALLKLRPFSVTGKLSYSIYLWHWPILILAAERVGRTSLPVWQSLGWVAVAVAASALTYVLVENPIRHASTLMKLRWASVGMGVALVAITVGVMTSEVRTASSAAVRAPSTSSTPDVAVDRHITNTQYRIESIRVR
jgi:peptidoglycan/LPS O-acetylase OafA/YrhL